MTKYSVKKWNANYPIGTPVRVRRDNGEIIATKTRAPACELNGKEVIWVDGISGCYLLERVSPITPVIEIEVKE